MIGIVYKETSIPLMWELLDKREYSSAKERKELMERVFKSIGKQRIKSLVGDREFVCEQWLKYLNYEGIEYHIRIKKNAVIQKYLSTIKCVKDLFNHNKCNSYVIIPQKKIIYKQEVYVSGNRTKKGDYFILISNKNPYDALKDYRQRWDNRKAVRLYENKRF